MNNIPGTIFEDGTMFDEFKETFDYMQYVEAADPNNRTYKVVPVKEISFIKNFGENLF